MSTGTANASAAMWRRVGRAKREAALETVCIAGLIGGAFVVWDARIAIPAQHIGLWAGDRRALALHPVLPRSRRLAPVRRARARPRRVGGRVVVDRGARNGGRYAGRGRRLPNEPLCCVRLGAARARAARRPASPRTRSVPGPGRSAPPGRAARLRLGRAAAAANSRVVCGDDPAGARPHRPPDPAGPRAVHGARHPGIDHLPRPLYLTPFYLSLPALV